MQGLLKNKEMVRNILVYCVADLIAVGMGMGVPFFCILLGAVEGWWLARFYLKQGYSTEEVIRKAVPWVVGAVMFSVLVLLLIWAPTWHLYFEPDFDLANYGEPLILYTPVASFIAWQVLMVLISPALQAMMIVLGIYSMLYWRISRPARTQA